MAFDVCRTENPRTVLDRALDFLASDPVRHNVILTLLQMRINRPTPGRYWIVSLDSKPVGLVFQSPLDFVATITPMSADATMAAVDAIVAQGVVLPGVNGEAGSAAHFAGHWTERTQSAATPVQEMRIYEVDSVISPPPSRGGLAVATATNRDLIVEWVESFHREVGEAASAPVGEVVDERLAAGQLWLWEDPVPVALAGLSERAAGVVRVGPVYTPPEHRTRGYASALVASVSAGARDHGHRCILYTDLANPVSNSIYRALGYCAVCEATRYRFDPLV